MTSRPEESYRLWRVVVCDQETSKARRLKPATGFWKYNQKSCKTRKTNKQTFVMTCRSQWPRGLKRRSSAARLLRLWVRIPPGAWMFVCCDCCVLSGRGFFDGLITRPEESYRLWRVVVCDEETSKTRRLKPATWLWKIQPQWVVTPGKQTNKHL